MIGQLLGQYRIVERLGEGGMGEVYRATDEMLDRDVALKMLRPELAHRPDLVERFRAEAVTLARLDHANIARLHGMTRHEAHLFMVMEFVPGQTLYTRVEDTGGLPWRDAMTIMAQTLDGLDYAHTRGVIHRDIKPANLILQPDGRVKITDFGIARVLGTSRSTRAGSIVGTLEYMAPEQIRGEEVSAGTDLYAVGILLYELLIGRVPFSATTEYELMRLQLEGHVPSVQLLAGDVPEWCDELIARALAKNPHDRFTTAADFRAEILARTAPDSGSAVTATRFTAIPAVTAPPTAETRPAALPPRLSDAPASSPGRMGNNRLMAAAAAAVLVMAVSIFAWRARRSVTPESPSSETSLPATVASQSTATSPAARPVDQPSPAAAPPTAAPSRAAVNAPSRPSVAEPAPAPPLAAPAAASPAAVVTPVAKATPAPREPVEFDREAIVTFDGKKARERDVILRFQNHALELLDRKTRAKIQTVDYSRIQSALYSRSRQPRWKTATAAVILGGVAAAPLFFLKGSQHWLTLEGAEETVVILRLDKNSFERVIPEFERRTGSTVTIATDDKK